MKENKRTGKSAERTERMESSPERKTVAGQLTALRAERFFLSNGRGLATGTPMQGLPLPTSCRKELNRLKL
jgi:hypothetical protein